MKRFKSIIVAALAVVVGAAYVVPALPAAADSAALSITPRKNYTIEPGKSVKDTLTIRNLDSEEELQLSLRVVDFTFTDEGGTPKLMLAEDAPQTAWSLKSYMKVPESVTIPPKSSKTLDMSVAVPSNQGGGSLYSAIVYSSGAPDGGNVGLSASGVTLVFTSIPGDVNEDLKLERFGAYNVARQGRAASYSFINTQQPENMAFTIKNNGNVTAAPVGSITIKHMFGKEQVINDVNPNSSLALIGQTRTFTACIKLKTQDVDFNGSRTSAKECVAPGLWPGYYSAKLDLFYGTNGNNTKELAGTASFWYLPIWFIVVFLIVLAIATFYIRKLVLAVRQKMYGSQPKRTTRTRRK